MRSWKKRLKKMCSMLAWSMTGKRSRQKAPDAIAGPHDAPRRYREHSLGDPPELPSISDPTYSASCSSEMRHRKVSVLKPGKIMSSIPPVRASSPPGTGGGSGGTMASAMGAASMDDLSAPAPKHAAMTATGVDILRLWCWSAASLALRAPVEHLTTPREQLGRKDWCSMARTTRRGGAASRTKMKCPHAASFEGHIVARRGLRAPHAVPGSGRA
mmetsp:Transcript_55613/g.156544  ORF Transcript_55613/g.156544 Transcript_55613/m.156544 type:complete len:215 (+) Transcript_55613:575-1219(+)